MKKRRKNKPGQGRKPEGRTRGTIDMLPAGWAALDAACLPGESRGKCVERKFGGQAAKPVADAGRKAPRGQRERAKRSSAAPENPNIGVAP